MGRRQVKKIAISIGFRILSRDWELRLLTAAQYQKVNGVGSLATTDLDKRIIDLSPEGGGRETVIHELVHAYVYEFCAHSMDLDTDNLEEFFAELLSKRGRELLDLGDRLYEAAKNRLPVTLA